MRVRGVCFFDTFEEAWWNRCWFVTGGAFPVNLRMNRMKGRLCRLFQRDVERRMRFMFVRARGDFVTWDSTLVKGFRVMKVLYALMFVMSSWSVYLIFSVGD